MKAYYGSIALLLALSSPGFAAGGAFAGLSEAGIAVSAPAAIPVPAAAPERVGDEEAVQYLPENNDNPGFEWPSAVRSINGEFYLSVARTAAYFKISAAPADQLLDGAKCALAASTTYKLRSAPVFTGENIMADLESAPGSCVFSRGYVAIPSISSTSAGGMYDLPLNARAFLDTLAYAEGTNDHYNYIYSFETFTSYTNHPRKRICSGGICSTAAGRYQFLSKTWSSLAKDLGLTDFTPPSQEKATMEVIRRLGAYPAVAGSSKYANFSKAIRKLNKTWASLPGSPYGQPTHSMAQLWKAYKAALAARK